MRVVTFLDTSVLCEVLRVPGKCQQPEEIRRELRERLAANESLLLPTAAIIETGNHIAQAADGNQRREVAERLVRVLRQTTAADPPWVLNDAKWDGTLITRICDGARGCPSLPDMAAQGVGAGDVSILAEVEAYEERVSHVQVRIWTLDHGLAAYA